MTLSCIDAYNFQEPAYEEMPKKRHTTLLRKGFPVSA